ncbi:MAG: hypothetical protein H0X63_01230 [Flavobacteriales bacterium]|nr:hypothetical protein [Flavobacteriales bacterium]
MIIKSIVTMLLVFAVSCNSKKTTTDNPVGVDTNSEAKMLEAGFKKGVLVTSNEEGDCPYTIKVSGQDNLFDPINLEEAYKSSGMQVWFKFRPLRMANRCEKANPIEITEIQKVD